ncbi:conserved uncharacterized protein, DUF2825 [Desulfosarcina variabilis str. Montpellier]
MWGTPRYIQPRLAGLRFIPTHVGNSELVTPLYIPMPVHPHACGELWTFRPSAVFESGSSPRMWGTLEFLNLAIAIFRFIPTHVGNSSTHGPQSTGIPVHPHACGELVGALVHRRYPPGSSPRMWGTRGGPPNVGTRPAVHPHACGELVVGCRIDAKKHGSSPRMWGTPTNQKGEKSRTRFIPTHVGNSVLMALRRSEYTVHPHACGELVVLYEVGNVN